MSWASRGARIALLTAAVLLFVGGTALGVKLTIAAPETRETTPSCETTIVKAGEKLTPNLVTVNVFNSSRTAGLANRVLINLQRRGFLGGEIGNSTSAAKVSSVTILTNDPKDPQVVLIAAQFKGKVAYAEPDVTTDSGISILVGKNYAGLKKKAAESVTASRDVSVCLPTVNLP